MRSTLNIVATIAAILTLTVAAEARGRHVNQQTSYSITGCEYNNDGHTICGGAAQVTPSQNNITPHKGRKVAKAEKPVQDANGNEAVGSGIVVSHKTGATAHLAASVAPKFQHLLNALEGSGATIYYMGGIRAGHCSLGSQHPCGWALDICQDSRGHVSGAKDCHLPAPEEMHRLIVAAGLYGGEVWCSTDYGHVQAKDSGSNCGPSGYIGDGHRHYYASMTGSIKYASNEPAKTTTHSAKRHHRHYTTVDATAPAYAYDRQTGYGMMQLAMDDGSHKGRYKSMRHRKVSMMRQKYYAAVY